VAGGENQARHLNDFLDICQIGDRKVRHDPWENCEGNTSIGSVVAGGYARVGDNHSGSARQYQHGK
jgi:hypothetical protein